MISGQFLYGKSKNDTLGLSVHSSLARRPSVFRLVHKKTLMHFGIKNY
jgi:hypothetical protein